MLKSGVLDPTSKPKRLLSIDGGGIRGVIAAEILIRIENALEQHTGVGRIADHFHLIGGTSTGAILAAGLALGKRASELRDFYLQCGAAMFKKAWLIGRLWHRYTSKPLARELQQVFGDASLGSEQLGTLLMIVSKNATTGSPWFFINNPKNPYYNCNAHLPLWKIVSASAAAPTYFPPETMVIPDRQGKTSSHEFIDGGMSMFNNPSFQLFLEATHPNYHLGWQTGPENILLVSVGTGFAPVKIPPGAAAHKTLLGWAGYAITDLMEDANVHQNVLMQLISRVPHPQFIDRELGSGVPTGPALRNLVGNLLLTYHRYTVSFTKERLDRLGLADIDPEKVSKMDAVDQIENLQRIGQKVAEEQVRPEDITAFFPFSRAAAQG